MPNRPSKTTVYKLWALCGNECANPDCNAEVIQVDMQTRTIKRIGEVAHIHGANPESNRYVSEQSDEDRHGFDNLLILCKPCHRGLPDGVDVPANKKRFPAELLRKWKQDHLEKIQKLRDRNWICHPNTASEFIGGAESLHIETTYWIDQHGRPQLYTSEQLAIVTQLSPLIKSFSQLQEILNIIDQTEGKPVDPSHQTQNDGYVNVLYRRLRDLKSNDYGWIGYLAETIKIAQDITLGELFLMMAQDGLKDRQKHTDENKLLLKQRAEQTDPLPKVRAIEGRNYKSEEPDNNK